MAPAPPLSIFLSYFHLDEGLRERLGLRRRGFRTAGRRRGGTARPAGLKPL